MALTATTRMGKTEGYDVMLMKLCEMYVCISFLFTRLALLALLARLARLARLAWLGLGPFLNSAILSLTRRSRALSGHIY